MKDKTEDWEKSEKSGGRKWDADMEKWERRERQAERERGKRRERSERQRRKDKGY